MFHHRCLPIPQNIPNTIVAVYADRNGAIAMFTCAFGYAFNEGGTSRTSVCIAGRWTDIKECQGFLTLSVSDLLVITRKHISSTILHTSCKIS